MDAEKDEIVTPGKPTHISAARHERRLLCCSQSNEYLEIFFKERENSRKKQSS